MNTVKISLPAAHQQAMTADLEQMLDGQIEAAQAARALAPLIRQAVGEAVVRLKRGGRLILVGAGTSGRIAVQDGVELAPTYGWPMERLVFLLAGGARALMQSAEAAEDDADMAMTELSACAVTPDDVVIGVAASGRTPYTCAAIRTARAAGALTIGIANKAGTALLDLAEIPLCADTGAEFIAGSTRMKAGTAQKIVLNTLSTGIMIGLGRTHDGLMTHMSVSNEKLRQRAIDIIAAISGASAEHSRAALEGAANQLPVAILMAAGYGRDEAAQRLAAADGSVGAALIAGKGQPGGMDHDT